jgi:hypothetical protein
MCGDQYSVEKGCQFAAKAAASLGSYSDDYESNMNIAKAFSRLLWTPGQLHVEFLMCNVIYIMFYPAFLRAFQAAAQATRLVQDSVKCFQLATTFLGMVYDQVYCGLLFHFLLNVANLKEMNSVHDVVGRFCTFTRSMRHSSDGVYRYLACFLDLCEMYFLYLECVNCADQLGCELIMQHFQPLFYLCNMSNYKELVWRQMDTLYGSETTIMDRETCRRCQMIRLNKVKNCMGTDEFGELNNFLITTMKKSKSIEKCADKSASVTPIARWTSSGRNSCASKMLASHQSRQQKRGLQQFVNGSRSLHAVFTCTRSSPIGI